MLEVCNGFEKTESYSNSLDALLNDKIEMTVSKRIFRLLVRVSERTLRTTVTTVAKEGGWPRYLNSPPKNAKASSLRP